MKQTVDMETQTKLEEPTQTKQELAPGIHIQEDLVIGQHAIFMPFSNNSYVGVTSKDEDRTLCHMTTSIN